MEDVKAFLAVDYGSGYGDGSGYGYGDGDGDGYGDGSGYGYGDGYGDGSGYGSGDGSGLKSYNGAAVYYVDGIPTLIRHVSHGFAVGAILRGDLTLERCYIAKGNNLFAHGETIKAARAALMDKMFCDMPEEDRIAAFWKCHNRTDRYSGRDLYDWHHRLTGSCEMGRKAFIRDHGLDVDATYTVAEFVALCENNFGGSTIRKLKE